MANILATLFLRHCVSRQFWVYKVRLQIRPRKFLYPLAHHGFSALCLRHQGERGN